MIINLNKKTFIVLRGLPGSGKSTFCDKFLKDKATIISPDEIRIEYNGIIKDETGKEGISQANPKQIWGIAYERLYNAFKGDVTVVLDATSLRERELNQYLKMAKENELCFIVIDFTSVSVDECKKRNAQRMPEYKRVPESVIDRMAESIKNKIQGDVKNYIYDYDDVEFFW